MTTLDAVHRGRFSRRNFLASASAMGTAAFLGLPQRVAAEPTLETTILRLVDDPAICLAPQYLAEEFLRLEGFSQISYVNSAGGIYPVIDAGHADMSMDSAPALVYGMDRRTNFVAIAGIHAGCYELFGNGQVHTVRDLKGKTVAVLRIGGGDHILLSSILAHVGIDPRKDIRWLLDEQPGDAMRRFIDGEADAFMGFAPQPQELRARKIGRVILSTTHDRPWSQYFCCVLVANRGFAEKNPVAVKRALRAYLKAADICAREPDRVARYLADRGFEPRYEIGLEVLKSLPYNRWRDSDPEDTLRFHALRLHEVGMIKTSPQKLLEHGTNWRFLTELKKELKA
jgi:NitT/TauT family transport system substrate-binding protein